MANPMLELLLPARCAACGRPGRGLCRRCLLAAAPLRLPDGGPRLLDEHTLALAAFRYDGVIAAAVRGIKRPGHHAPVRDLAVLLWLEVEPVLGAARDWPRTWVPSTRRRLRQRGADIPRTLAGSGSRRMVRRVRQVHDQAGLGARARRVAPRGDFRLVDPVPPGVVLVDDVCTTGATALAVASALRAGGARKIVVVTLASVPDREHDDT